MRSLIIIIVSFSLNCPDLQSDNWSIHQNNYQFTKDTFYFRYRDYINLDKTHFTFSKKISENLTIQYQHWNNNNFKENRPRFDYRFYKKSFNSIDISFTSRNEWRVIKNNDKFIRSWIKVDLKKYINRNSLEFSISPRFNFDKEKYINSSKRDIRVTLFFNYKINDNWKISPGIWYVNNENDEKIYSALKILYQY